MYVSGFERGAAFDVVKQAIVAKGVTVYVLPFHHRHFLSLTTIP